MKKPPAKNMKKAPQQRPAAIDPDVAPTEEKASLDELFDLMDEM